MNRGDGRCHDTTMGSAWGVDSPSCTMTMTATATGAGATVCITMHSWQ